MTFLTINIYSMNCVVYMLSLIFKHFYYFHYSHKLKLDWSNVKILACDYKEHNSFYLESLIILKHKSTLNKMQTSVNINLFT